MNLNKKLVGIKSDSNRWRAHSQASLDMMSARRDRFDSDSWAIVTAQGNLELSFKKISARLRQVENVDGEDVDSTIYMIKFLFLESTAGFRNKNLIRSVFFGIFKTYYYLALRGKHLIDHGDLDDYYQFILSRAIFHGDLVRSSRPIYLHRSSHDLCRWNRIQRMFGFDELISESIENKHLAKALKAAIPRMTDSHLSYSDWRAGLGLNTLTLEFGIYYVDHCVRFFDKHIDSAIAVSRVYEKSHDLCMQEFGHLSFKTYVSDYRPLVIQSLQGVTPDHFFKPALGKGPSINRCKRIYETVIENLDRELLSLKKMRLASSDSAITYLANQSSVRISDPESLYIKELINIVLSGRTIDVMMERRLFDILGTRSKASDILNILNDFYDRSLSDLKIEHYDSKFYKSIGCQSSAKKYESYIVDFIDKVRNAGQVVSMAFTGWRGSELGYSAEDIRIQLNNDILDSELNPFRYKVLGRVPKTHGDTRVDREITSRMFDVSINMALLNASDSTSPCLLKLGAGSQRKPESIAEQYKRHIGRMWSHFVDYYPPFVDIRGNKNKSDTHSKAIERVYKRISDEYEIATVATSKKNSLVRAIKGNMLSDKSLDLMKSRLPKRMFDLAFDKELDERSSDYAFKRLSIEIVRTILKPTPHSFRHMWAEAVYRRFDGDVGWAIRSNFKHITQDMWLYYVRDKSHQNMQQQVKSLVVSSLLKNYVEKNGHGYAGAIDTVMRRMLSQTKVVDQSLLSYHAENYGEREIEDIKSTPWGFCLLRSRTRSKAKCAEDGVPQRSNASPSLCLGCSNNLAMSSSIEGILLSTSNDLKVLENDEPKMPDIFKNASRKTVKLALRYLQKLNADQAILDQYNKALEIRDN